MAHSRRTVHTPKYERWSTDLSQAALVIVALGATFSSGGFARADEIPPGKLEFNRDIRPILFDNCITCHGPDSASRQADLRLDDRETAIDFGAIVPGDPDSSELIRRVLSEDESEQMPPPEIKRHLTPAQKQLLVRWIQEGAEYEPHWSLIAPERPSLPVVSNSAWCRNPIDNFIAAKLEANGLEPAPEADRRTLARRLSLDLTGLPPTPEMVDAFVNDPSPDAYERVVEKLIDSPQWGEHRGRYWLDVARYADTHGIHFDNYREMWSYRDWVINAFNRNMPYDKFTIESLAGDLLPEPTLDQQIASGFNRCNITTNEGGAIDEEYLVLYTRDRIETTTQVWLGLTAGCAVCHDHKFDPISQREFFELAAFFNNTTQEAMDGNIKDTPPVVVVPCNEDRPRWEELPKEIAELRRQQALRHASGRDDFADWLAHAKPRDFTTQVLDVDVELAAPLDDGGSSVSYTVRNEKHDSPLPETVEWRPGRQDGQAAYLNRGAVLEVSEAGDFNTTQPFTYAAWVKLPANDSSATIISRMDDGNGYRGWDLGIEGRMAVAHISYYWPEHAIKVATKQAVPADEWVHLAVVYNGSSEANGLRIFVNGVAQETNVLTDSLARSKSIRNSVPLKIGQRNNSSPASGVMVQDVRVYARDLPDAAVRLLSNTNLFELISQPAENRAVAEIDALYDWWLASSDREFRELDKRIESINQEGDKIKSRGTIAYVMQEKATKPTAFVLNRGEYDQRLDEVAPDTPEMLPPFPETEPRNRLGFANWLLRPENPLTARVTVNRFWSEIFGTGLVRTAGDFGVQGELPTHPELLDWLAVEFRESGWDVKQFYRQLVLSAAYRQSAVTTPEKLEKDPDNQLISRGPRFRMDAEMVRDYALASSGLLVPTIGGPSVKPYQPPGVWEAVAIIGSNTGEYKQDTGNALYRRSMYTFWKRSAPPGSMDVFNAPARETCTLVRERTNTPLQALVTLNDPQFIEAARNLAGQAIQSAGDDDDRRLDFIAQRLLSRSLRSEELEILHRSLQSLLSHFTAEADEAKQLLGVGESPADASISPEVLAAWTMVTNELLNLDEVLNK